MKKVLALILATLMLVSLFVGCAKQDSTTTSNDTTTTTNDTAADNTASSGAKKQVAVLVRLSDMYGAWLKEAYIADAKQYDDMEVTVFDTQDDSAKFIEILEACIEQSYDYAVVQGRQGDLSGIITKAKEAGIKLIQINYAEEWTYSLMHSILCDEHLLGELIAADAAAKLPENAQVAILNGPAGLWVSDYRREGFQTALLDARPDITLLDEQDAGFVKDTAMNKTSDWLQGYDHIDAILCASDSEAVGAVEAYKANNVDLSNTLIYGIDGLTEACTAIMNGDMEGSALQDATTFSSMALEMIEKDIAGEIDLDTMVGDKETAVTEFAPTLIDASNAEAQYKYYEELGMTK